MRSLSGTRMRLVVALAGLNVLLAVGGWLLLVAPQRQHAQSAAQQLQQAQNELAQLGGSSGSQAPHVQQPLIHTADLYRLAQAMPVTANEPDLLLALDQLARASGVRVLQVSPQIPTAAVGYVELPIQTSLAGNYASLTRYLARLRLLVGVRHGRLVASGRLISVTSVAMTPATTGKGETATVDLMAYVFGSVNGTAPLSTTSTTSTSTSTTSTTTTTGG